MEPRLPSLLELVLAFNLLEMFAYAEKASVRDYKSVFLLGGCQWCVRCDGLFRGSNALCKSVISNIA